MKSDKRYRDILFRNMGDPFHMDRRNFMKKIGTGLIVAFSAGEMPLKACSAIQDEGPGINSYLRIGEDGRVTLYTGKIEMGQGPITSLPMELADELDVRLEDVDMIMGDTDICPWDEGTYGSLSTRVFGELLRSAAARARAILLEMASRELSLDVKELEVRDGIVRSRSDSGISISYAGLTRGKQILETHVGEVALKDPSEFRIMGTSRHRVDSYDKVTGGAKFAGDIEIPGMLRARILRPPSLGARLVSIDTTEAEQIVGVEVVREGDFVAVLHPSQHMADQAIEKIRAEWEEEVLDLDQESLYDYILKVATESRVLGSEGDLSRGRNAASKLIESTYRDPYLAHSPMENHSATAVMEDGRLKVWASCQTPYPTRDDIAEETGMDPKDVQLLPIYVGGGFGGKTSNPQALEAARLVKLSGKPVQVVYTREEEFMYDRMRPAAVVKVSSGLDDSGKITFWEFDVHMGGGREAEHFYDIPHHRTRTFRETRGAMGHPFFTGAWRAPSVNTNTFARESQMDIMAVAAGTDPLEFRLKHLEKNPRMHNVVKTGAERFGWVPAKGPSGRGQGFAVGVDVGTDVVVFVEIEVDRNTGFIQVKRAVCCQDMGMVVNPQGAIIQAEGCMLMGLGYALMEEIRFQGRKMLSTNYDTYSITQFNMVPDLEVVLVDSKDKKPHGGGEPAIVCMGAAIANALFDASGARIYRLPLTPQRVREALNPT